MRIAIIGSRTFLDFELLESTLNVYKDNNLIEYKEMISGGAKGSDTLGEKYADKYNIPKKIFYPDWNKHGKIAGFLRNQDIINNADIVFAFWDGKSKGTQDSIRKTRESGKILIVTRF